jgi:hypothetical protein
MSTHIYRKLIYQLSLFGIAVSILVSMYDVIFAYLFESLHILFEMIESSLDELIEHFFHTDLHQTQTIAFYVLFTIGLFLAYLVCKAVPHLYRTIRQGLCEEWGELRMVVAADWQNLSVTDKVMWISGFLLVNLVAFFLLS